MKRIFIGHRGSGKSSLLHRHQIYFSDIPHFDLDREIETATGLSISEIFSKQGEARFRELEISTYEALTNSNFSYAIAVGAGFTIKAIKESDEVVYVSRITDIDGRLFLSRPRLNKNQSPLEEYKQRYQERDSQYLKRSQKIYFLPEGLDYASPLEKRLLEDDFKINDAVYTLTEGEVKSIESLMKCYLHIELRTDLISSATIEMLIQKYTQFNWLVSFRNKNTVKLGLNVMVDWDTALGERPQTLLATSQIIISSHSDAIDHGIDKLSLASKAHLKLSPLVANFNELRTGYEWQQKDPQNRSFLPRSKEGRWIWYRQFAKYLQKLNFIKNYTLMPDQPTTFEWLALPQERPHAWAAVLGQPIHFSRTPVIHKKYFALKKTFVTKINISSEELKKNLSWLATLNLTYVAVTSPLKETAYEIANTRTEVAMQVKAVNTLYIKKGQIDGHNTDVDGFKSLVKNIAHFEHVAVWGGGGTLKVIFSVLPEAFYFSSQTAHERSARAFDPNIFKILIWAAPRSVNTVFPAKEFGFSEVIDLNYVENSMGLEYAMDRNLKYTSGLEMFREQALKQQEYWSSK
ncbi:MAG: hypothetical protein H7061_09570 [Bdellovibrionaceae bacterium]|nr:hypothetical protein [Bdellovibrio sp.]